MSELRYAIRGAPMQEDLSADLVDYVFRPLGTPDAEARETLSSEFPQARWDKPVLGPLADIGVLLLTGTMSLAMLATTITKLTCHVRKHGVIIDLRPEDLSVTEVSDMPGCHVVIVARDDSTEHLDMGLSSTDLTAAISAAMARPSTAG
jgi:hypothetical protein